MFSRNKDNGEIFAYDLETGRPRVMKSPNNNNKASTNGSDGGAIDMNSDVFVSAVEARVAKLLDFKKKKRRPLRLEFCIVLVAFSVLLGFLVFNNYMDPTYIACRKFTDSVPVGSAVTTLADFHSETNAWLTNSLGLNTKFNRTMFFPNLGSNFENHRAILKKKIEVCELPDKKLFVKRDCLPYHYRMKVALCEETLYEKLRPQFFDLKPRMEERIWNAYLDSRNSNYGAFEKSTFLLNIIHKNAEDFKKKKSGKKLLQEYFEEDD